MPLRRELNFTWTGHKLECESSIAWAIAEQSNGLMAIIVNVPGGVLKGYQLKALAEIAGEDGLVKNTRRMAPILIIPKEKVADALTKLEEVGLKVANLHGSVRNIVSCPGKGFSKNSRGNTLGLAEALDEEFYGTVLPWDFKIGISGCPRNCSAVQCHDVGLMAELRNKFSLWIGGTESGMNPRHGSFLRKGIPRDKVPAVLRRIMQEYADGAEEFKQELGQRIRLYHVIEKTGLKRFSQAIAEELGE